MSTLSLDVLRVLLISIGITIRMASVVQLSELPIKNVSVAMKVRGIGKPMKGDPCGSCTEMQQKRMGGAQGGSQTPPRRKRRTVPHQKGMPFPGNWAVNNSPKAQGKRV